MDILLFSISLGFFFIAKNDVVTVQVGEVENLQTNSKTPLLRLLSYVCTGFTFYCTIIVVGLVF